MEGASAEQGREGSFGLVRYLDRAAGARVGGTAGGGDVGTGEGATAGVGARPVTS